MRAACNSGRRKLNETEERLLERSLESSLGLESRLAHQKKLTELAQEEKGEALARVTTAFGQGASAAASLGCEVSDRLAERLSELMREFQRKTLHLNRTDADLFMRMLQLQSSFLEGLDRRLTQSREKHGHVYETALTEHAAQSAPPPANDASAANGVPSPPAPGGPLLPADEARAAAAPLVAGTTTPAATDAGFPYGLEDDSDFDD